MSLVAEQVEELQAAVERAQREGRKESRERVLDMAGPELRARPFRWVELSEPPLVYFPDAWRQPALPEFLLWSALAAVIACIVFMGVAISESDPPFALGFACAALLFAWLTWRIDSRAARQRIAREQGVETCGLYLTPTAVVSIGTQVRTWPREQVLRFCCKRVSAAGTSSIRFREFMELKVQGQVERIALQDGTDPQQRELCERWRQGQWPLPLPAD